MSNALRDLSDSELKILLGIFEKLSCSGDSGDLRRKIANDLLELLHADYLASFIWNPETRFFDSVVFLNMTTENLNRYQDNFRFCDTITPVLQERRKATLVCEVMDQKALEKTEFFNDFLMFDGLHHGINLYAYDGDLNIGDLRIWRAKNRPDFGAKEALILDTILPYFRNALKNARILSKVRHKEMLWEKVLETTHTALYLFEENGQLLYRNNRAGEIEVALPKSSYDNFFQTVRCLVEEKRTRTEWGPYSLSFLKVTSPSDGVNYNAVIANKASSAAVDRGHLIKKRGLSPRETDIALLVCKGLTDREIADVLTIAFSTVRTHLKHLFRKLDVTNRTELIFVLMEDLVDFSF